jgi:general secretion pathway protein I
VTLNRFVRLLNHTRDSAFTLLEVMIAMAVVAIALMSLLALQHQSLQSVIRSQESTKAALLAQDMMTRAELDRFPELGTRSGDFQDFYPDQYPAYRWQRIVEPTADFADVRKVRVRIIYGPRFSRSFDLIEFLHNPFPPEGR